PVVLAPSAAAPSPSAAGPATAAAPAAAPAAATAGAAGATPSTSPTAAPGALAPTAPPPGPGAGQGDEFRLPQAGQYLYDLSGTSTLGPVPDTLRLDVSPVTGGRQHWVL